MVAVGITLQCFGTVLGPGFQGFLDGHTQDATLGLAPSIGDPFTGTMWSKDDSGTATTLQCLGFASDPRRFLDGHTQDATLGLAPTTDPPFTGTRWAMLQVPSVALQCLGDAPGPGFQGFLDGHTQDATLGLAATTDPPFTGTRWQMREVSSGVFTFQCLGDAPGPGFQGFLDGHTQDATLGLAATTDPPFTGTRWQMRQVPSEIFTLQCLGDAPGPGFQGFLDGHTQDATLGLAATTDPPFTGTRWRANFQTGLNVSVQATKHQEGAFLTITGGGFPQGGQVDIALFGVPRRINPSEIFSATANEPGGSFHSERS